MNEPSIGGHKTRIIAAPLNIEYQKIVQNEGGENGAMGGAGGENAEAGAAGGENSGKNDENGLGGGGFTAAGFAGFTQLGFAQFKDEFDLLSENNDDPIGVWLKNTRARGKIDESLQPIIHLLVELHRKIDAIAAVINDEKKAFLPLESATKLESIGHSLLIFPPDSLTPCQKYYGRLDIAIFPPRKVPLFFEALDAKTAKITLMHERDEIDFDAYIAARERSILKESKRGI